MPVGRHRSEAEGKIGRAIEDSQDGGEAGEDHHRAADGKRPTQAQFGKLAMKGYATVGF